MRRFREVERHIEDCTLTSSRENLRTYESMMNSLLFADDYATAADKKEEEVK